MVQIAHTPTEVLDFWFGDKVEGHYPYREIWFYPPQDADGNVPYDDEVRSRFAWLYTEAVNGWLTAWQSEPLSCLALLILLDQFSRNLFRDTPQMYAADAQALAIARSAIDQKFDQGLDPVQQWFFYLPFEHHEYLPSQDESVRLHDQLTDPVSLKEVVGYAHKQRLVIQEFDRYPHRNAILGRTNTPKESEYLRDPKAYLKNKLDWPKSE